MAYVLPDKKLIFYFTARVGGKAVAEWLLHNGGKRVGSHHLNTPRPPGYRVVIFVRNPFYRVLSHWHVRWRCKTKPGFYGDDGPQPPSMSFREFLKVTADPGSQFFRDARTPETLRFGSQVEFYGSDYDEEVAHESLEEHLEEIIGCPVCLPRPGDHRKVALFKLLDTRDEIVLRDHYNTETVDLLLKHSEEDFGRFGYLRELPKKVRTL